MEINTVVDGDKATVSIAGKLTVQTSPDLSKAIEAIDTEVRNFDIDLSEVGYVSSAGLRVLVAASKLANKRGGAVRLLNPVEEVVDVFEMTGLSEVFDIVR